MSFSGPLVLKAFWRFDQRTSTRDDVHWAAGSRGLWPSGQEHLQEMPFIGPLALWAFWLFGQRASVRVVVNWTSGPMGLVGPLANDHLWLKNIVNCCLLGIWPYFLLAKNISRDVVYWASGPVGLFGHLAVLALGLLLELRWISAACSLQSRGL